MSEGFDWGGWQLVAHRCGGALAPENSLAGLAAAARTGVRAVEFDVMLSADGVPLLIHDETLDRTTGGHGPVAARPAAELLALACNRGWGERFAEQRIPTLGQALAACRAHGLVPNIEVKPSAGRDRATGLATAREAAAAWDATAPAPAPAAGALPLLSSFSESALAAARELLPDWPAALLVETVPRDWRARLAALGVSGLHCRRRQPGWRWLDEARAEGVAVRCYTVNDPAEAARLRARGVIGVFTDRIDALASAVSGPAR